MISLSKIEKAKNSDQAQSLRPFVTRRRQRRRSRDDDDGRAEAFQAMLQRKISAKLVAAAAE